MKESKLLIVKVKTSMWFSLLKNKQHSYVQLYVQLLVVQFPNVLGKELGKRRREDKEQGVQSS